MCMSGTVAQPVTLASRRLRPEDPVVEVSLGYKASLRAAWVTQFMSPRYTKQTNISGVQKQTLRILVHLVCGKGSKLHCLW